MKDEHKIRSGYRVLGLNAFGEETVWYFPDLENAKTFAEFMAHGDLEYDIVKYVGSVRRAQCPVEWIEANKD